MTKNDDSPLFQELWNYGNPAETRERFEKLLPDVAQERASYGQLLTQIARTYGLEMIFDKAHAQLDKVEALLAETELPVVRVRYCLESGRVLNSSKQGDRGWTLFEEAWQIGLAQGFDFYAVDAAHMLGIVGDTPAKQHEWNLKAMAHAEQSSDPHARGWLGSLYNNIGWTHHDAGEFDEALTVFDKAVQFFEESNKVDRLRIAHWCVARTYRSLGRVEEALAVHEGQLKAYEADGEEPGYTYEEIGECLLALGREEESRPFFGKAYAQLSQDKWLVANEPERLKRLQDLWQNDS